MNKSHKVRVTKTHQQHAGTPVHKPGKAYKGANFIPPKEASVKKSAQRQAASRKKTK